MPPVNDDASTWCAASVALLRSAGLPSDWLVELSYQPLHDAYQDLVEAYQRLSDLRRKLVAERRARGGRERFELQPLDHESARWCPPELIEAWNRVVAEHSDNWQRLDHAWDLALRHENAQLTEHLRDEAVRECLLLMSPSAHRGLTTQADRGGLKASGQRVTYRYLQRFCGKAETIGASGPLNILRLRDGDSAGSTRPAGPHVERIADPCAGELRYVSVGDGSAAVRRTFLSYWAAETLIGVLLAETPPETRRIYRQIGHGGEDFSDLEQAALGLADGSLTLAEVGQRLGADRADVTVAVQHLEAAGALSCGVRTPAHIGDTGAGLRALAGPLDSPRAAAVRRLVTDIDQFATLRRTDKPAELQRLAATFEQITQRSAWRGQGEFYSDRMILVEEASDNIQDAQLGDEGARRLVRRCDTALDLLASIAVEHRLRGQHWLRELMRQRGATHLAAVELCGIDPDDTVAASVMPKAFTDLIDSSQAVVSLTRAELEAAGLIRADLDRWPLSGAADVMLLGPGRSTPGAQLVLSEVHHIWPNLSQPNRELIGDQRLGVAEVERRIRDLVAPARPMVQQIRRLQRGTDTSAAGQDLLCLEEMERGSFVSAIGVDELVVREWANGFIGLSSPVNGDDYWLFPEYDDPDTLPTGALIHCTIPALELPRFALGTRTPRIVVDGVIIQRGRWDPPLPTIPLPDRTAIQARDWYKLRLWQAEQEMPRYAFFITDAEPKPMWLDFESPVSLTNFAFSIRKAARVTITEMLPRPDQLWLTSPSGRHVAEIRILLTRTAPAAGIGAR